MAMDRILWVVERLANSDSVSVPALGHQGSEEGQIPVLRGGIGLRPDAPAGPPEDPQVGLKNQLLLSCSPVSLSKPWFLLEA